jgi:hypothetical protein
MSGSAMRRRNNEQEPQRKTTFAALVLPLPDISFLSIYIQNLIY